MPLTADELGRQKLYNCGLNTSLFVCRYFQVPGSPSDFASELGLGAHYEHPTDLGAMKRAMESRGLFCQAFRDATPEQLIGRLDRNSLWVAHLKTAAGPAHFCVLGRHSKSDSVAIINAAVSQDWLTEAEAVARLKTSFTGWCMRVARAMQAPEAFDLDSPELWITFGIVNGMQGSLVVRVPVNYSEPGALVIESYAAPCGCLRSVASEDSDRAIEQRGTAVLVFEFDRKALGVGTVETEAVVRFAGPTPKDVTFHFSGELRSDAAPVVWFPEKVDVGIITSAQAKDTGPTVRFMTSGSMRVGVAEWSPGLTVSEPVFAKLDAADGGERSSYTFTIRFADLKPGPIKESVTFQSTCASLGNIVIPVRGEYRP